MNVNIKKMLCSHLLKSLKHFSNDCRRSQEKLKLLFQEKIVCGMELLVGL